MRIYDISQEIFSSPVYESDPVPVSDLLCSIGSGDAYNLSSIKMCVHTGTHIDAPSHFLVGGKSVDKISLSSCVGPCVVLSAIGPVDPQILQPLIDRGAKRLLFKGKGWITQESAQLLAKSEVLLVGTENLTIGNCQQTQEVHCTLLKKDVVILEGLVLKDVPEGNYVLCAPPLSLGGLEGAPCRAILVDYSFFAN